VLAVTGMAILLVESFPYPEREAVIQV